MTIRIVTDSTCDLPPQTIAAYRITVIPMYIHFGAVSYQDGVDLTRQEFYRKLASAQTLPTTALPGPDVFQRVYEQLGRSGASQVLSIHVASSLSSTVEAARAAAAATRIVPVTVLDSRQLSLGMGFLVERAAQVAEQGQSLDEILTVLEDQIRRSHVFAAIDTLEFLRRSGRMSRALAGIGTLLSIKPVLRMHDGIASVTRLRTSAGAESRLVEWLGDLAPLERVALVHANAPERASRLMAKAAHLLPPGELPSVDITPVIGTHIGPGAAGFACVSAPRQ